MRYSKLCGILVLGLVVVMLFLVSCVSSTTPTKLLPPLSTNPASSTTASVAPVTVKLVAQNMAFDQSTIRVQAGAQVTLIFDNKDSVSHNFALYTDSSAATAIFKGDVVSAKTITYQFTAPSTVGTFFFRCDIHPQAMTGKFIVQ